MSVDLSRFRQTFIEESREGLDVMETGLLGLDSGATDADTVNAIFRAAHSIKGGAGTFGFAAIATFTHLVETLLDQIRSGTREATPPTVALLLGAVDVMRALIDSASAGQPDDDRATLEVAEGLRAMLAGERPAPSARADAAAAPAPAAGRDWQIRFAPHAEMLARGNEPYRLLRELGTLGTLHTTADLSRLPSLSTLDPEACHLAWDLTLHGTDLTEAAIRAVFEWVEDECVLTIASRSAAATSEAPVGTPGATTAPAPSLPAPSGTAPAAAEATSLRVNTEKLDDLVNLVGELVITQSMLGQIGREYDASKVEQLIAGLATLERNTRELQESVMRIRMVPISYTFNRFPRMVHDLCSRLGKKVELRVIGEGTELDKTVIEKIGDPLVHVVRNALDHGLETPAERLAAGKPETGVLRLSACHRGGEIVIEISDDGRGIPRERVRAKAIERGVISADAALSEEQVLELVFHPGFSTADAVSDLSGRGVGMDVVRRNIKALGGSVELKSREGEGTALCIRLPLTLAILDGQLARIGPQTFVVPLVSIVESLKMDERARSTVAGRAELYRLRDEYIPVLRAHELLGLPSEANEATQPLLMIVEAEGRRAGVVVDELLAQQQVVIKSLEANFRAVRGLSGATILGDGTVALILDVPGLIELTQRGGEPSRTTRTGRATAAAA